MPLVYLVVDLDRDAALRERFQREPLAVLKEYHLPEEVYAILRSGDMVRLLLYLSHEASQLTVGLQPTMFYWAPPPNIASCSPDSGNTGTPIQFTITGKNFLPKPAVQFTRPNSQVSAASVQGTETEITCSAQFSNKGSYDLTITFQTKFGSITASYADAFTAT